MSFLRRLFSREPDTREAVRPLYGAIVAEARAPAWYLDGSVPDTVDGRFDMVAAVLSLVLIRLERDGDSMAAPSALLAELFVEDMDGQLRQLGIGDIVVGKHIGKMMSALGGRLTVYRDALTGDGDLAEALARNLWRGEPAPAAGLEFDRQRVMALWTALDRAETATLIAGDLPKP